MKRRPCGPLSLIVSAILVILILAVSGCICINGNVATPTPTANPLSTTTPSPTSSADAAIVGLWEGHYKSVDYSMEFYEDGKFFYNEGGNMAIGRWEKIDEKQYQVHILIYNSAITLNDDKTQFVWGDKEIIFTKRT